MSFSPIEQRVRQSNTNAFVVTDTVDHLAEKMIGIIADRRMTKMHRYLGENSGTPSAYAGLRVDRTGLVDPVSHRKGRGVGIHLASRTRGMEGIGFNVNHDGELESAVAERYHHPEQQWLGQRRHITFVELTGWAGSPASGDKIRIEYWNEHGVGQETIIVFDDIDCLQEIAWDVKGDVERQVHLWDQFCIFHGLHFEHPDHPRNAYCDRRESTRAEDLTVLAYLSLLNEKKADDE